MLTPLERQAWERDGFFVVRGFAPGSVCKAQHERAVAIAREAGGAGRVRDTFVQPEAKPNPEARSPEDNVSKIFRLHRDEPVFRSFAENVAVLERVAALLGPDLDCFSSQFIFKNAGALGQPWHQDAFYFRFDRTPQVTTWLAITEATLANGCLHVLPGSHREPVHQHEPDPRPGANYGYLEIPDHDFSASIPVLLQPGDLLVFHSFLMHRSTDNETDGLRAAMVFHYAEAGTRQLEEKTLPIYDWMPVRRSGAAG